MASISSEHYGRPSPPKYRRQTLAVFPNGYEDFLGQENLSRPHSALDRRWVHRSHGDLTSDQELQISHPRLQTDFYQELYKKYPNAFRQRQEQRLAGRKLFNSRPQVRFDDEVEFVDDRGSMTSLHLEGSNRHVTNWDKEVGHYLKHRSRSRECLTSVEPSECSGSVLSLSQRLRLNSQTLHKLLNEQSPLRKKFEKEREQFDSGTENEQSLQEYLLDKSRTRSRNRTRHRRVLQRKIDNAENGADDIILTDNERSKRWISKSVSPKGRLFAASPISRSPRSPEVRNRNDKKTVNVDEVMAGTDLKIDTLLEKMNKTIFSPESPPDSAIDVDTPSVQSFVTGGNKGSNSLQHNSSQREFHSMNGFTNEEQEKRNGNDDSGSSPGSSVSARFRETDDGIVTDHNTEKDSETEKITSMNDKERFKNGANISETNEIKTIVDMFTNSATYAENYTDTGPGLLQFYTNKLENDLSHEAVGENSYDFKITDENNAYDKLEMTNQTLIQTSNSNVNRDLQSVENEQNLRENLYNSRLPSQETKGHTDLSSQAGDNSNYHADDEDDACEVIAIATKHGDEKLTQKVFAHRDSDVDSGIGQSSTGTDVKITVSSLPPRGRLKQKETTPKLHLVKAEHIIPSRSDVDSCILHEVNMVHHSHDLSVRGRNSKEEEADDTDIRRGITKVTEAERKLAEKYRRTRSPSPYILTNRGQPSPIHRPRSAPSFLTGDLEMRIVDISLSNDNLSDLSSSVSSASKDASKSTKNFSVERNSNSCQSSDITSVSSNLTCVANNTADHSNSKKLDISIPKNEPVKTSSSFSKQRKHSSSSISSRESFNSHKVMEEKQYSSSSYMVDRHDDPASEVCNIYRPSEYNSDNKDIVENGAAKHVEIRAVVDNREDIDTSDEHCEDYITRYSYGTNPHVHVAEAATRTAENAKIEDEQREQRVHEKKGIYKPSVTSPRVKEKRLKLRNILKNKRGSFSPTPDGEGILPQSDDRNVVNRIYAKDRHNSTDSSLPSDIDSIQTERNTVVHRSLPSIPIEVHSKKSEKSSRETTHKAFNSSQNESKNVTSHQGRVTPYEAAMSKERDRESVDNFIAGASTDTFTAKPVVLGRNSEATLVSAENRTGSEIRPHKNEPPVKPARTKHKKLPPDLNLSKYKITANSNSTTGQNLNPSPSPLSNVQSNGPPISNSSQSLESPASKHSDAREQTHSGHVLSPRNPTLEIPKDTRNEIEVLPTETSNLQKSKALSASKGSLLGDFKMATKGKFKAMRKAMSLERGIDRCGVEQNPSGNSSTDGKGGHSGFPKMKKAPSLKSLTSLFGRKKKKKGKLSSDGTDTSSTRGSTLSISSGHSAPRDEANHREWASCHSLSPAESPNHQPIGKLQKVNPDGTQLIQLFKPQNGPIGFFIAKGNAKYRNGIFVSRFSDNRPESLFAGLLGIGDEILEINGHLVRDLSQDAVYNLISASPIVVMKVFPFIARKDV